MPLKGVARTRNQASNENIEDQYPYHNSKTQCGNCKSTIQVSFKCEYSDRNNPEEENQMVLNKFNSESQFESQQSLEI